MGARGGGRLDLFRGVPARITGSPANRVKRRVKHCTQLRWECRPSGLAESRSAGCLGLDLAGGHLRREESEAEDLGAVMGWACSLRYLWGLPGVLSLCSGPGSPPVGDSPCSDESDTVSISGYKST